MKHTKNTEYLGRVLWFDERDGYGVIKALDGTEHYVDLSVLPGRQPLREGTLVRFQLNPSIKHLNCARNVEKAGES
jgi:cold shock CspA family protein